jgi:hypothetical protein
VGQILKQAPRRRPSSNVELIRVGFKDFVGDGRNGLNFRSSYKYVP